MADKYKTFASLAAEQQVGRDYRVVVAPRDPSVVVIAPHGGMIEPTTSKIAAKIAGSDHSLYCFEGLIAKRPHGDLHITSTLFDEPEGTALVAKAKIVLAVHGRSNGNDTETVWLGGRDIALVERLGSGLHEAGFRTWVATGELSGTHPNNICNRGTRRMGGQLELPRALRDTLDADAALLARFADAARTAIYQHSKASSSS